MRRWLPVLALVAAAGFAALVWPGSRRDSSRTYEVREVQDGPRPLNVRQLQAVLQRTYPPHLRDGGVGGTVEVRMRVDQRGVPHELEVMSSTHQDFDAPTLAAVSTLRFAPARVDRKPVQVWVLLPVEWRIDGADPGDRPSSTAR